MRNKINFVSGETYTLAELFSGNRKIIIPDLQRDYCWGNSVHTEEKKELVSGFVNTLIQQFEDKSHNNILNLGLIYGYEAPANHIQLCDGQQRITTLYLLLGMLNRKVKNNIFRKYLISDYEYLQDDKEPYLQYSIRESSLYFLSDLVCHFFIKEDNDRYFVDCCNNIKHCSWFFNEYNYDPSICSMLRALELIDNILNKKNIDWCEEFGMFLSTRLTFMYYDMGNRKNGEETFVVINTTGEPLSNTQNLKPMIYSEPINENYVRLEGDTENTMPMDWEEIETWFWKNRKSENDTADAGFNEFLRWVTMLQSNECELKRILSEGTYIFPKEKISFESIYSYWKIVEFLFDSWEYKELLNKNYLSPSSNKEVRNVKVLSQINCFELLPLIAYCSKWGISENNDRNLLCLYQFLQNLTKIDNVRKTVNDLVSDVILVAMSCKDLVELIDSEVGSRISKIILSNEELLKLRILKSNPEIRVDIENAFWETQSCKSVPSHNIWSGQILPLIEWATVNETFDLDKFIQYSRKLDQVFKGDYDSINDIVRRALLTRKLKDYPRIFRGNTNYSFGWEWGDWNILINDNKDEFKAFFDDLMSGKSFRQMTDMYPQEEEWAEFVHRDYLLDYCKNKNIQWDERFGWILIPYTRATKYMSVKNLHIETYLSNNLHIDNWGVRTYDESDAHVVVVENTNKDIAFDIWYQKSKWYFQLFKRRAEVENALKPFIDDNWVFNGERYEKSIDDNVQNYYSYPNVIKELTEVISKIPNE